MAEIIRTWLRSRLGVIIDLRPEIFGRYCRDGTFLAKLLHSYDIINDSQLQTITQTSDPALARINLRHLQCWLKFIGVDCNDACIRDISNGKGTASLRLFYKVFLCLENKDRLHFITLQREREKYIPNSTKFDVKVVPEELPIGDLSDHSLAAPLTKNNASLTNWYKKKFQKIIDDCKLEREKFCASQVSSESLKKPNINKYKVLQTKDALRKKEMAELDKFAEKHQVKPSIDNESLLNVSEGLKIFPERTNVFGNPEAANQFMKMLKCRKNSIDAIQKSKVQMQQDLLSDVWDKIAGDQEREFDRIIARKILNQSQYEKQMVKKLCDIRSQKNRIAANRQIVDEMMMDTRENEMRMLEETARQDKLRENEEVDDECRRMNELHQRINVAKQRQRSRKIYQSTMKIVRDIVDISVKTAEFKRANDNYIPVRIWNEWKALFNKNLPILEFNDFVNREGNGDEGEDENEELIDVELTKKNILNKWDFEDYQNIKSPWDEFMPELDDQIREFLHLGSIVLGYIVHKLLSIVYPPQPEPVKPPLPDVKIRAVVIGIPNSFYSPLQGFLKQKKIQSFTVEDAINYCLHCYKEEIKDFDYIDINIGSELRGKSSDSLIKNTKHQKKKDKIKKRKIDKMTNEQTASFLKTNNEYTDKETQTPKLIPYEDIHPQLSDTAYFGKWAYEIMTHGDSIPDDLVGKIIIQYLKNFVKVHGWVLLNYPKTHEQMVQLEFLFMGCKIPEQTNKLDQLNSMDIEVNEIGPRPSRITFAVDDNDSLASCRISKLLPNPLNNKKIASTKTYLTGFIKILPKPKNFVNTIEEGLFEFLPEDMTSVDHFYANQGIASAVYYTAFNNTILKQVARIVMREKSSPRISTELSKDASLNWNDSRNDSESKKSVSKVQMKTPLSSVIQTLTSNSEVQVEQSDTKLHVTKPGEPDWIWTDFYLAPDIIDDLVTLWENLEDIYLDGLKEILALKRSKFDGVVPYKDSITRHMAEFIMRPDNKQELVHQFQVAFNDIPADMRDDDEVKCELHCRVEDFQAELWDICDTRRREAEEEQEKIITDHRTAMEIIILINIYIGMIELEMDRFVDTMQFIQDYYLSMLKHPITENKIPKIVLYRFISGDNPNDESDNILSESSLSPSGNKSLEDKNKSPIRKPPLPGITESDLKQEINDILLRVDATKQIDVTQTSCFRTIEANIKYAQSLVDDIFISINEKVQKENVPSTRRSSRRTSRKRLSEKSQQSEHKMLENQKIHNLLEEWQYALKFELNRIRMRLLILERAKNPDIEFILGSMKGAFFSIRQMLDEKYKNEIKNVDDATKIFGLAIEKEVSIQEEIILDGNNLSIHSYSLMYSDEVEYPLDSTQENFEDFRFTISQLGRLKDIFQHVAPSGFIAERSFVYILQDLITCTDEISGIPPLAASWYELKSTGVIELVHELFGNISYIEWREFLIYAMEIPMPNQDELLDAKEAFANMDHNLTGIIYREQFISQPLWFINSLQSSSLGTLLHENFEKDECEMFEEEFGNWQTNFNDRDKFKKPKKTISFWINSSEEFDSQHGIKEQQKNLRMTLIKELLCEMYLNSYHTVNYIVMLLAFCKDDDPSHGFGKALSLTLDQRVCIDFEEGEKYVSKLIEETRLLAHEASQQTVQNQDAIEVSEKLLEELLDKVIHLSEYMSTSIEGFSSIRISDTFRETGRIVIEKLDQPGETIDPATLLIEETSSSMGMYPDKTDVRTSNDELNESLASLYTDEKIIKSREREINYWLPMNTCESVLSALIPFDTIQDNIFDTGMSFTDNLRKVYCDVECKELNNVDEIALVHRVVHHPFITQLLKDTKKFTSKNLSFIVEIILNNKLDDG